MAVAHDSGEVGGAEAGSTEWVILAEEIAKVSAAACQLFQHFGAVLTLRFAGTPEQQRLFPRLEDRVACLASTEAHAGVAAQAVGLATAELSPMAKTLCTDYEGTNQIQRVILSRILAERGAR